MIKEIDTRIKKKKKEREMKITRLFKYKEIIKY